MTATGPTPTRPSVEVILRKLTLVVNRATRAPSVHNTQPWQLITHPNGIVVRVDRERQLSVLDPQGRELFLSCGCLLFNLRVTAAAAGLHPQVVRFPDPADPDVVAWVGVDPAADGVPDDSLAELDAVVTRRHNNRRNFSPTPVPPELVEILKAASAAESVHLVEVSRRTERAALAQLSQRADAAQLADPAYRSELRAWLQDDPERPDGIPSITVPRVGAGSHEDVPIRDFDGLGRGGLPPRTGADREQSLLVLSGDPDDREGWSRVGEALERIMLEIARFPVPPGEHPAAQWVSGVLSQSIEVPEIRSELRRALPIAGQPMMVLRVGIAPPSPGTPRRALTDVVVERREPYVLS